VNCNRLSRDQTEHKHGLPTSNLFRRPNLITSSVLRSLAVLTNKATTHHRYTPKQPPAPHTSAIPPGGRTKREEPANNSDPHGRAAGRSPQIPRRQRRKASGNKDAKARGGFLPPSPSSELSTRAAAGAPVVKPASAAAL